MTEKPKTPVLTLVPHSSNIHALGYDAGTKTLTVQFKDMRMYNHHGVSQEHFDALRGEGVEGHSVGKHYHQHIRGHFETTRLEAPPRDDATD